MAAEEEVAAMDVGETGTGVVRPWPSQSATKLMVSTSLTPTVDGGCLWIYRHRTVGDKQKVEEVDIEEGGEGPPAQKPKGATAGSKTGRGGYYGKG